MSSIPPPTDEIDLQAIKNPPTTGEKIHDTLEAAKEKMREAVHDVKEGAARVGEKVKDAMGMGEDRKWVADERPQAFQTKR
ncbi:hypothetical protein HDU96_002270 [Phlyctochytrium bullatum]|nr:hypothetical protein HDU96_002270 [Phlyctochytrium bullatum]